MDSFIEGIGRSSVGRSKRLDIPSTCVWQKKIRSLFQHCGAFCLSYWVAQSFGGVAKETLSRVYFVPARPTRTWERMHQMVYTSTCHLAGRETVGMTHGAAQGSIGHQLRGSISARAVAHPRSRGRKQRDPSNRHPRFVRLFTHRPWSPMLCCGLKIFLVNCFVVSGVTL